MARVAPVVPDPPAVGTFAPEGHVYTLDGIAIPSVTQVLEEERFIDFSGIPDATLDQAKVRGSYVHQALHYYLVGDLDLWDIDERYRGYFDSALEYLARLKKKALRNDRGEAIAVEWRFWHRRRMFAGTIDYLGWDDDEVLSIDDWKTGEPSDVAAPLQTAAYELGVRDCLLPSR